MIIVQNDEEAVFTSEKLHEYQKWGLTINESKTEFLSTNSLSKTQFEESEFDAIDNFKYLGSIVQVNGSLDIEFDKIIVKRKKVISILNSILWNTDIRANTK